MRVVVTGATGFIGREVLAQLAARGDQIHVLARNPEKVKIISTHQQSFPWAGEQEAPPSAAFDGADAVIHLAGEPVNGRFTPKHKERILNSRVEGTKRLMEAIAKLHVKPKIFVCASGVGYYGERGSELLTEESAPGTGFLADVCKQWEDAAMEGEALGMHVARVRIGIVLGKRGGALREMLPPFKLGLGGSLAGGKSWMSWIHVTDAAAMLLHAMRADGSPVYNATAPTPVTNAEFTKTLGRVLRRPTIIPVPRFALKAALGEMADVVLMSDRVLPREAEKDGFVFQFPELRRALQNILGTAKKEREFTGDR